VKENACIWVNLLSLKKKMAKALPVFEKMMLLQSKI